MGGVTDTYRFDAYGHVLSGGGPTPNTHLLTGEKFDFDLACYYLRARYLDVSKGKFITSDIVDGESHEPQTLHKYLYGNADPVNRSDPSGLFSLTEVMISTAIASGATIALNVPTAIFVGTSIIQNEGVADAFIISVRANASAVAGMLGAGIDLAFDFDAGLWYAARVGEFGLNPVSVFRPQWGVGYSVAAGAAFGVSNVGQLSGRGNSASFPIQTLHLLPKAWAPPKAWGLLTRLARMNNNPRFAHASLLFGLSGSGPASFQLALRSNSFTSSASWVGEYVPLNSILSEDRLGRQLFQVVSDLVSRVGGVRSDAASIVNGITIIGDRPR